MIANNHQNHQTSICHECDLTVNIGALCEGQKASCPRCRYTITCVHKNATDRILVFSLSAIIFLVLSNLFYFVKLNAQGREREISLFETAEVLFALNEWVLGLFLFVVMIAVPAVFSVALAYLALSIKLRFASRRAIWLLRLVESLRFWNMAEIFFLGVLVSMIKVVSLADISLGVSFWTYALFSLFLISALLHTDKFQLAHTIRRIVDNNENLDAVSDTRTDGR